MAGAVEKWQAKYLAGEAGGRREPDPLVVLAAQCLPPGLAIDLACGAGRHALFLASRGWRVQAVDGAPAALELFDAPGIEKVCLDLETYSLPLSADLVVCTFYMDRLLWPRLRAEAAAVAMVLPMADEEPMNPTYLVEAGELDQAFRGWRILRSAVRQKRGSRRVYEFLAERR